MEKLKFSIIVPVYNRPEEMVEFLDSLTRQTDQDFEVLVMEGKCDRSCQHECQMYSEQLNIRYYCEDCGRSERRNLGMKLATGNYFLFFDSDVTLGKHYIETVRRELTEQYEDCFGGPDRANSTFTTLQLAINFAMTSMLTTGGIRGKMRNKRKYTPRSFNMGFSRKVFEATGGYLDMIGEDTDLSLRIKEAGFTARLIDDAYVYHKRRISLSGFYRQTNTFGKARLLLAERHPGSLKLAHLFPTLFVLAHIVTLGGLAGIYAPLVLLASAIENRSLRIALLSIVTSYTMLFGYGIGFLDELFTHKARKAAAESLYRQ